MLYRQLRYANGCEWISSISSAVPSSRLSPYLVMPSKLILFNRGGSLLGNIPTF